MVILCMHNEKCRYYKNSSVIVDLAMGQIPHSTECISSYALFRNAIIFDAEACLSVST